jgi:hypothetical protein
MLIRIDDRIDVEIKRSHSVDIETVIAGSERGMYWNIRCRWYKWATIKIDKTRDSGGKTPEQFYSSKITFLLGKCPPTSSGNARSVLQFFNVLGWSIPICLMPAGMSVVIVDLKRSKNIPLCTSKVID